MKKLTEWYEFANTSCLKLFFLRAITISFFLTELFLFYVIEEAGWTPDQYGHSRYKPANATDSVAYRQQLNAFMRGLLKASSAF